jgi:hypothetical protein
MLQLQPALVAPILPFLPSALSVQGLDLSIRVVACSVAVYQAKQIAALV